MDFFVVIVNCFSGCINIQCAIQPFSYNTFWSKQNGPHFTDNVLKWDFFAKCVPQSLTNNNSVLVQVMALHWTGVETLPEPMMTQFIDAYRHYPGLSV